MFGKPIEELSEEELFRGAIVYCSRKAIEKATRLPRTRERLYQEGLIDLDKNAKHGVDR